MMRLASVAAALSTATALAVQLKSVDEDSLTRPRLTKEEKALELEAKKFDREVRKKAQELDRKAEEAKELEALKLSAELAKKKEIAQLAVQRKNAEAGELEPEKPKRKTLKEQMDSTRKKWEAAFPWKKIAREHAEEMKRKAQRTEAKEQWREVEMNAEFKKDTAEKKMTIERTFKKETRREEKLRQFNKKNQAEYESMKAALPTGEVKEKADVCACMNWKEVYHKGYAQCGQGLEMTRLQDGRYKATLEEELADVATWHKDVVVQTLANEEFCEKSYKKMDTNACVRTAMEPSSGEWYGQYWCYVHPDCRMPKSDTFQQVPHRGTHIKICGPNDDKMGDWTPQEVISFGKQNNMPVPGFLVKIAYPTERKCFKKTEDAECQTRMKDIRRGTETTVVDETDEHGEKWIYQGDKAWILPSTNYEGFLQVEPLDNVRELFRAKKPPVTPVADKASKDEDGGVFQPPQNGDWIITPDNMEPHRWYTPAPVQAAPEPIAPAEPVPLQQAAPEPIAPAVPAPPQQAAPEPVAPAPPMPQQQAAPEPIAPAAPAPPQEAAPQPIAPAAPAPPQQAAPEPIAQAAPVPPQQAAPEPVAPAPPPEPIAPAAPAPPQQAAPEPIAPAAPAPIAPAAPAPMPEQAIAATPPQQAAPETVAPAAPALPQ